MPVLDKQGKFSGYLGTINDITKERTALLELTKSEEKYRLLVEQASDAIYITDTTGRIITVNKSACLLSQYTESELLQMSIYDFLTSDDLQKEPLRFEELKQGSIVVIKRQIKRKDGHFINLETTAKMLSDGRILVFARDITESLKAEQALKESEEKYRTLVEQASDGIYIADINGRIITVNPSACKLSGYSENEILEKSITDFIAESDLQNKPLRIDELRNGKTIQSERGLKQKNGDIVQIESLTKMLSDGRILVFLRDITERLQARNEIVKERNLSNSIINSLPGIFYLYDDEGNFIRWNKNFEFVLAMLVKK